MNAVPRLTVTNTPDLLVVLPWLLGYTPRDTVVLIGHNTSEPMTGMAAVATHLITPETAPMLARFTLGLECTKILPVVYCDTKEQGARAAHLVMNAVPEDTPSAVIARAGVWHMMPLGGEVGQAELYADARTTTRLQAECVALGLSHVGDRESIRDEFVPVELSEHDQETLGREQHRVDGIGTQPGSPDREDALTDALTERVAQWLTDCEARTNAGDGGTPSLTMEQVGHLIALLQEVRDPATRAMRCENAAAFAHLWTYVARHTQGAAAATPLVLAALAHYLNGDGARCRFALDRVTAEGCQTHPLAAFVREILESGVRPQIIANAVRDLFD